MSGGIEKEKNACSLYTSLQQNLWRTYHSPNTGKCVGGKERFIEYQDEENGALLAVALLTWIFQCAITIITGKPELGTRGRREQRMY